MPLGSLKMTHPPTPIPYPSVSKVPPFVTQKVISYSLRWAPVSFPTQYPFPFILVIYFLCYVGRQATLTFSPCSLSGDDITSWSKKKRKKSPRSVQSTSQALTHGWAWNFSGTIEIEALCCHWDCSAGSTHVWSCWEPSLLPWGEILGQNEARSEEGRFQRLKHKDPPRWHLLKCWI